MIDTKALQAAYDWLMALPLTEESAPHIDAIALALHRDAAFLKAQAAPSAGQPTAEPVGVIGEENYKQFVQIGTLGPYQQPTVRKVPMLFKDLPVGTMLYAAPPAPTAWQPTAEAVREACARAVVSLRDENATCDDWDAYDDCAAAIRALDLSKIGGRE